MCGYQPQAKSMPNSTKSANQSELSHLLKTVGLNRHLSEREIKVFPSKAWEILFLSPQKEKERKSRAFISSSDSLNKLLLSQCALNRKLLELKNHFLND